MDNAQPLIQESLHSLAGNWVGNMKNFLGFWTSDNGSEFGIWRSEDRPCSKLLQRLCGSSVINDGLLRHFRSEGVYVLIPEDQSFIQWGCPGNIQKLSLDGSAQTWLAPVIPLGLSTFWCTSRSNSLIAFEWKLPHGLARIAGELKLTSDGRAFHLTVGGKRLLITLEFARLGQIGSDLQGPTAERWCNSPERPERLPSVPDEAQASSPYLQGDHCWVTRLMKLYKHHAPSTALDISATMLGLAAAAVVWKLYRYFMIFPVEQALREGMIPV